MPPPATRTAKQSKIANRNNCGDLRDVIVMQMLTLLVLYANALLTLPLSNDCGFFPSLNGDRVLVACRPGDVLSLVVHTADGAATSVQIEANIARDGVPTGPAAWSPSNDRVALEIGLDEEPGILLVDLTGQPMAVFVDRALVDSHVSGTQPQWDASGKWLIFATSGTGDWEMKAFMDIVWPMVLCFVWRRRCPGDSKWQAISST